LSEKGQEKVIYTTTHFRFGIVPTNLLPDVVATSQDAARTAIRHERRVELGLEFHRFFDLMRYGKQAAEAALTGTNFTYDNDRYFPIPFK